MPIYLSIIRYLTNQNVQKNAKLIELGSGSGRALAYLKSQFSNLSVYGVDYSKACVDYAAKNYAAFGVTFMTMQPAKAPFRDQSFDYVISSHVIEHIKKEDGQAFLLEVKRLLKKGGVAFIGTPNRERCQNIYLANPNDDVRFRLIPPHEHEYTETELLNLAQSVFDKDNIRIDAIANQKFATIFAESIAQFRPSGSKTQLLKQSLYRFGTKFLPRPVFDKIAQIGTKRIMTRHNFDYDDILYANTISNTKSKNKADNFLLVCKK